METEYLHEYIEFSKTLNYAKAAESLFISQPTLRAHIHALEDEIGAPLAVRRVNQVVLSPVGKLFLKRARDIVSLTQDSVEACSNVARESASLLVGFLEYPWLEDMFVKARENLALRHPEKRLELSFSPKMSANIEAVVNNEVDLTVYPLTRSYERRCECNVPVLPSGVSCMYLGPKECRFWMTRSNPLFEKKFITARDLTNTSLLLGNTKNMLDAAQKFMDYFASEGISIEVDNQPFSSYADYYLSDAFDIFGIILEGHRFEQQPRKDLRIFSLQDFRIYSDLYVLYDEARFNECGLLFIDELANVLKTVL